MIFKEVEKIEVCAKPIFVVGCPRSGTSVMSWSLAQHSKVWTSAESDFLVKVISLVDKIYEFGTERESKHWLSREDVSLQEFLEHLGYGINALYTNRSKSKRWVEQTPLYSMYINEIAEMFPKAQFVHILRDGRDVVNSMIQSNFEMKWANNFSHAGKTWADYVNMLQDFEKNNPERIFTVKLENLIKDSKSNMKEVCGFLDLRFEKKMCTFFMEKKKINSSFTDNENEKKDWRLSWSDNKKKALAKKYGSLLSDLGYEVDGE